MASMSIYGDGGRTEQPAQMVRRKQLQECQCHHLNNVPRHTNFCASDKKHLVQLTEKDNLEQYRTKQYWKRAQDWCNYNASALNYQRKGEHNLEISDRDSPAHISLLFYNYFPPCFTLHSWDWLVSRESLWRISGKANASWCISSGCHHVLQPGVRCYCWCWSCAAAE